MSRVVKCPSCGKMMPGLGSMLSGNFAFTNVAIGCPHCGHSIPVADGFYSIIDGVIAAFTAPGMTREKVEAAKGIAKEASEGAITTEDALQRLEVISGALASAVTQLQGRKVNWEFLLALLALIWTIWSDRQSDADAQAALAEAQTQTEVAQKMLAESRAQTAFLREATTKQVLQRPPQAQKSVPRNRAERRKAAAVERRTKGGK